MESIVAWRKDEKFDKKNFNAFMREVATQAKNLQDERFYFEEGPSRFEDSEKRDLRNCFMRSEQPKKSYKSHPYRPSYFSQTPPNKEGSIKGVKRKRGERDNLPSCLNTKCGGKHFIQYCEKTDDATKNRLREEYRAAKKARLNNKKIATTVNPSKTRHSALFSASFTNGNVSCDVLADQGADSNLISRKLFSRIKRIQNVKETKLTPVRD